MYKKCVYKFSSIIKFKFKCLDNFFTFQKLLYILQISIIYDSFVESELALQLSAENLWHHFISSF